MLFNLVDIAIHYHLGVGCYVQSKVLLSVFKPKNETPSSSCELWTRSDKVILAWIKRESVLPFAEVFVSATDGRCNGDEEEDGGVRCRQRTRRRRDQ